MVATEILPEAIEDRALNLHPLIDQVIALSGRKVLTREYCQLMDALELWVKEYPQFTSNEDSIVKVGVKFLKEQR